MAIRVGNADNSRYRSPRRMQVYKPFRLRGPLDAVHRMHRPSLSLSLSLSRSLLVSVGFVPSVPTSSSCPLPPDPFARFINLALLSTLSLSLSLSLSPLLPQLLSSRLAPRCCSFAISTSFLRIAIASGKHDKASDFIRYRRLSTSFIFSGHSLAQAFSQEESTCATYPFREK